MYLRSLIGKDDDDDADADADAVMLMSKRNKIV